MESNVVSPAVVLEPAEELIFRDKFGHVGPVTLVIKNKNMADVYFKVKSTASKFFSVRPSVGTIKPHGQTKVIIQPPTDSTDTLTTIEEKKHRFMIQSAFVDPKTALDAKLFWKNVDTTNTNLVTVAKLRAKVVRPQLSEATNGTAMPTPQTITANPVWKTDPWTTIPIGGFNNLFPNKKAESGEKATPTGMMGRDGNNNKGVGKNKYKPPHMKDREEKQPSPLTMVETTTTSKGTNDEEKKKKNEDILEKNDEMVDEKGKMVMKGKKKFAMEVDEKGEKKFATDLKQEKIPVTMQNEVKSAEVANGVDKEGKAQQQANIANVPAKMENGGNGSSSAAALQFDRTTQPPQLNSPPLVQSPHPSGGAMMMQMAPHMLNFLSHSMYAGSGGYANEGVNESYARYIAKVLNNLPVKSAASMKKDIAELIDKYEQHQLQNTAGDCE